jgi:GC-rich sequence DNA-binding factor
MFRQLLLKSVVKAFENVITDTETSLTKFKSAQPLPGFNPDSIRSRQRYLFRRVKLLRNLLTWRKYTGELFGLGVLVGRLVDVCILEVAQSGWDVGGEDVARQVCPSFQCDDQG